MNPSLEDRRISTEQQAADAQQIRGQRPRAMRQVSRERTCRSESQAHKRARLKVEIHQLKTAQRS